MDVMSGHNPRARSGAGRPEEIVTPKFKRPPESQRPWHFDNAVITGFFFLPTVAPVALERTATAVRLRPGLGDGYRSSVRLSTVEFSHRIFSRVIGHFYKC